MEAAAVWDSLSCSATQGVGQWGWALQPRGQHAPLLWAESSTSAPPPPPLAPPCSGTLQVKCGTVQMRDAASEGWTSRVSELTHSGCGQETVAVPRAAQRHWYTVSGAPALHPLCQVCGWEGGHGGAEGTAPRNTRCNARALQRQD